MKEKTANIDAGNPVIDMAEAIAHKLHIRKETAIQCIIDGLSNAILIDALLDA